MKKVMAIALLTMLSNWASAAEAPLTAVTNVSGSVAASTAPAASSVAPMIVMIDPRIIPPKMSFANTTLEFSMFKA